MNDNNGRSIDRLESYRARPDETILSRAVVHWSTVSSQNKSGKQWTVEITCKCGNRRRLPLNVLYRNTGLCQPCSVRLSKSDGYTAPIMHERWFDHAGTLVPHEQAREMLMSDRVHLLVRGATRPGLLMICPVCLRSHTRALDIALGQNVQQYCVGCNTELFAMMKGV